MAKYVMANRRAGLFNEGKKRASRAAVDVGFSKLFEPNVDVLGDSRPADDLARRVLVFDADPREIAAKQANLGPDVLIEQEILHFPLRLPPIDLRRLEMTAHVPAKLTAGKGKGMSVTLLGGGAPLPNAQVILYLRGSGNAITTMEVRSSANGSAHFEFGAHWTPAALLVEPAGGFWTFVARGPVNGAKIDVPPLPQDGPLGWWHQAVRISQWDPQRGQKVRVGVIDTGVGPHPNLAHVNAVGAFIDGNFDPKGGADSDMHGSHVCGIVGARPGVQGEYGGIAPGCELVCARVFPPGAGANQGDIVAALDHLSRTMQVDLVNMSLGSSQASQIEHDAIIDALERGTLCVVAAGNEGGEVSYPAHFPECVAVSALGFEGWAPPGALASTRTPEQPDRYGADNLYLANFSCFGPEIDCATPGVGIISTVPANTKANQPRAYAAMDGTSMASPVACGALAGILSMDPDYASLPRDKTRAHRAAAQLHEHCQSIHLGTEFEGQGLPKMPMP